MRSLWSPRCQAQLHAVLFALTCASPALAQPLPYIGRWQLDDSSRAQGPYTVLTIKDASMSWSGPKKSAPACVQQFVLRPERLGTVYTNGQGTRFVAGLSGSLWTYLLTVTASSCGGIEDAVRISFPLVYDTRHIEVIEYVKGKPVTSRRFHRKK